jgi:hypothetical protein
MTTKKTAATTAKKSPVKKAAVPAKPAAKPAVKAAPKPAAKKAKKEHKVKVVRDSFTMPQSEYQKIAEIKAACLKAKMHVKKSEVLRAGLKLLAGLNAAKLKLVLSGLEKIKTGRPKKH